MMSQEATKVVIPVNPGSSPGTGAGVTEFETFYKAIGEGTRMGCWMRSRMDVKERRLVR